jgi:hypothetical protein
MSTAPESFRRHGLASSQGARRAGPWMLVLLLSLAIKVQGQTVTISALAEGTAPLKETTAIRYTRFADFSQQPSVFLGLKLEAGDLLESTSEQASRQVLLEVTCPQGSLARFSGRFRVVIQPGEKACAFDMLTGNLDFLAVEPTEVGVGGAVAGSQSTQYGIRLSRKGGGVRRRILVFEGEVLTSDRKEAITAGTQLVYEDGAPPRPQKIEVSDLKRTADVYARFDVSKAISAGAAVPDPEQTAGELSRLHYDVLLQPADAEKRTRLGSLQQHYKIDAEANYNLTRGHPDLEDQITSRQDSKYFCTQAVEVFARGDAKRAESLARKALKLHQEDGRLSAVSAEDYATCKKLSGYFEKEPDTPRPPRPTPPDPEIRDSKYFCTQAIETFARGDAKGAASLARTALGLHEKDHQLAKADYESCRKLAAGSPK